MTALTHSTNDFTTSVVTPPTDEFSTKEFSPSKDDFSTQMAAPPKDESLMSVCTPSKNEFSATSVAPQKDDFSTMAVIPPKSEISSSAQDLPGIYLDSDLPPLPGQIINAPYQYITSLPSKGLRSVFTSALNHWLKVPENDIREINQIVETLHNASLMVDDIQDESALRRGRPSTHMVFGVAQTINSAMFYINEAMASVQQWSGSKGVQIALGNATLISIDA
ncbi:polyprenyl synthetase [Phlyctema vagabunda]|uniref:Polyprenyl synthetase n=1 Tax=Phlyctema vagabunda TaxID=108571 RepID=A0ABR4PT02_9HELO